MKKLKDVAGDVFAWGVCIAVVLVLIGLMLAGNALLWGAAAWAVRWARRLFGGI